MNYVFIVKKENLTQNVLVRWIFSNVFTVMGKTKLSDLDGIRIS